MPGCCLGNGTRALGQGFTDTKIIQNGNRMGLEFKQNKL